MWLVDKGQIMNKKTVLLFAALAGLCFLTVMAFIRFSTSFYDSPHLNTEQLTPKTDTQSHETTIVESENDTNYARKGQLGVEEQNKPQLVSRNTKSNLEDSWCIAFNDLKESELFRFIQARNEWDLQRGSLIVEAKEIDTYGANPFLEYSVESAGNAHLIEPYLTISAERLEELAEEGDTFAMTAILKKDDGVDIDAKRKYAEQLLIRGKTAESIPTLLSIVLAEAELEFQYEKTINDYIKQRINQALVYTEFGLSQLDPSGLTALISIAEGSEALQGALAPSVLFSDKELENIATNALALETSLDLEREKIYLEPISFTEKPPVAKKIYDATIAIVLWESSGTIGNLGLDKVWAESHLQQNDCMTRHIARLQGEE
ncbi:hypothetical protein PN836_014335 [Ningiella sp. W23]|uniref:hypothetical protein n=1 Tax=Ningiella sp. W23 TaxID=3023715 RepID=UPI0037582428